jgi:2-polyprenyl-3-methyl-5-hydroxy-6-metoxy-1,4-benzoquinol methylase
MDDLFTVCPNGCHSELYTTNYVVAEGPLKKCSLCGQLLSSCSKTYYEKSNQDYDIKEGTWPSKKDFVRLLKRRTRDIDSIAKMLSKNYHDINMLDVGCSNGSTVFIANNLGLQAEGVDPAANAVQNGKERGIKLHLGFLEDVAFTDNLFDAITLYEVIEHVADPIPLLKECHRILRANGIVLIGTGNTDSWTCQIRKSRWDYIHQHGGHVSFFSPRSLEVLARQTGFTVVKVRTSSVKFCEKKEVTYVLYRLIKSFTELLNLPAKILNKGDQMEVFLISNKRS